jgi:hypothetical protein
MPVSGLDAVDWMNWSETGWIELDWDGLGGVGLTAAVRLLCACVHVHERVGVSAGAGTATSRQQQPAASSSVQQTPASVQREQPVASTL